MLRLFFAKATSEGATTTRTTTLLQEQPKQMPTMLLTKAGILDCGITPQACEHQPFQVISRTRNTTKSRMYVLRLQLFSAG